MNIYALRELTITGSEATRLMIVSHVKAAPSTLYQEAPLASSSVLPESTEIREVV